jgi:hypothetical protein
VLRGYPTVRWRAWLEIRGVKTHPVLNCRLENVVVDKSPLHQPPFNRRGHACSLLTRTTSGRFWANGRRLGNSPDVNGHLIVKGASDSDVEICSAHLRLVAIKKPHVHTRTSGLENPELRTRSRPGNKLIFFKRERRNSMLVRNNKGNVTGEIKHHRHKRGRGHHQAHALR